MIIQKIAKFIFLAVFGLTSLQVTAAIVTMNLDYEFSGGVQPAGIAPWIVATFDDGGTAGSVSLTMDLNGLTGTEFITTGGISFNLDPSADLGALGFTHQAGQVANSINTGIDAFKADGDGFFDIQFLFDTAASGDRFGTGESSQYLISGLGITASSFDFQSINGVTGAGNYAAAAHVGGIGVDGIDSGWIGPIPVPVPAAIWLFGSGLLGLIGFARIRKN